MRCINATGVFEQRLGIHRVQRLPVLAILQEQSLGCMARSDPTLPSQAVLTALVRIKQSGEIERIIARYTQASDAAPTTARAAASRTP